MRATGFALALSALLAAPAAAQFGQVGTAPQTWASVWVTGLLDPGTVVDHDSNSDWRFGSAIGLGAGVSRLLGTGLTVGVETSFIPASYERIQRGTDLRVADGRASLVTALAAGRLRYGGAENLQFFLNGGAGVFVYGIPDLDRWDPDPALFFGPGLEYRPSTGRAIFLDWGTYWAFHQAEGVGTRTVRHTQLRLGGRLGW
jgi:hypothetical protein